MSLYPTAAHLKSAALHLLELGGGVLDRQDAGVETRAEGRLFDPCVAGVIVEAAGPRRGFRARATAKARRLATASCVLHVVPQQESQVRQNGGVLCAHVQYCVYGLRQLPKY